MKKVKSLICFCLIFVLAAFFLAACGETELPDDQDPGDWNTETTIDSILDKENPRPDFDDMFDYDSGYTPMTPIEPEVVFPKDEGPFTAYRMEAENAEFKIAATQTDESKLWQNTFTDYHKLGFDLRLSNCLATRNLNEPGTTATFAFDSDKSLSEVELKMLVSGYPRKNLALGSIFEIRMNGKVVDTADVTVNEADCEQLGHNEYMIFKLVSVPVSIQEGENTLVFKSIEHFGGNLDYIELNTSATISGWNSDHWSDEDSVWNVTTEPTIAAAGTLSVSSTVTVDSEGTTGVMTQSYTLPVLSEENGYALSKNGTVETYSFELKGKEYTFVYDPDARYTVTLDAPAGIAFVGGGKTADLQEGDALPVVINNTDRTIAGWYNVDDKNETWTSDGFSMPKRNLTIAPYYAVEGQALTPGSGSNRVGQVPDYFDKLNATDEEKETEEYIAKYDNTRFVWSNDIIDGEKGRVLSFDGELTTDDYFRVLTACGTKATAEGIIANHNYGFRFNVKNYGAAPITFQMIQVQSGILMSEEDGAVLTGDITLQPGESQRVSIDIKLKNDNANAMTIFLLKSDVTDLRLGISMSKLNDIVLNPSVTYTLTLAENANVTFADGATTAELSEGEALPEVVNETGRTIAGWMNLTDSEASANFVMPAKDVTVMPYFAKKDGYTDVVPLSEQAACKPGNLKDLLAANFIADSSTRYVNDIVVNGGEDGVAELGKLVRYDGEMINGAAFRINTIVNSSSAVVLTGVDHVFSYNFENNGNSEIDLIFYQVNSSTTVEDGDSGTRILLQPGESMSVEITANFANGSDNKNALTYFVVNAQDGMTDMKLGMSMSVKLGTR